MFICEFQYIPIILNLCFHITVLIFSQSQYYQPYFLGIYIILMTLAIAICIIVRQRMCPNFISIDFSPFLFEILILSNFMNQNVISNNYYLQFGFILGQASSLQKINCEVNEKHKYWIVKSILQQTALILYAFLIEKDMKTEFIIFLIILIIIVGSLDIHHSINKHQLANDLNAVQSSYGNQYIKQQSSNLHTMAEKYQDNWVAFIGYKNKKLHVEKLSNGLQNFMAEKSLTLDSLLNRIQTISVNLDMENIVHNTIITNKIKLQKYITQLFIEEYQERDNKIRKVKGQKSLKDGDVIISPNESKRRITLTAKNDMLQRGQTIQLNQFSLQYFGDKLESNSLVSLLQVFNNDNILNQNIKKNLATHNQQQQGLIQQDDGTVLYVKISIHFVIDNKDCGCLLIIENNHNQFSQYLEFLQVGLKSEVTQKYIKEQARKTDNIKNQLLRMTNQASQLEQQYLQQVLSQIYLLSNSNQNIMDFLTEDAQFSQSMSVQEFRIDHLLSQTIDKIKYHPLLKEKKIDILVQNNLKDSVIQSNLNKVRQVFLNFILNSIKQYHFNNTTNLNLEIIISLKDNLDDMITVEISDTAGGFTSNYDFQRIREGQLGLYSNLRILPYISRLHILEQRNTYQNGERGCCFKFVISKTRDDKLIQQPQKLAQLICLS